MSSTQAVDLSNCDREPIHQLGAIQPFCHLLAFTADWTVARASANIGKLLGISETDILGMSITDLLPGDIVHLIRGRCTLLRHTDAVERIFSLQLLPDSPERLFDAALHLSGRSYVLEIEESRPDNLGEAGNMVRSMMTRLAEIEELPAFLREGARLVRAVTQYGRVMVYQFDRDGNGTVVAEAVAPGMDRFLGLHYPASDIPQQARQLYVRAPFRIIADVNAAPVPIYPLLNERGEPLDLSMSIGRAVSPIHIEYLQNMGVSASLSISIIVDGKLWGLFACHNNEPLLPSFNARTMAELFGQLFSLKLESRLRTTMTDQEHAARKAGDSLLAGIAANPDLLNDPDFISETLSSIIANDGIATVLDGKCTSIGSTPAPDDILRLVRRLNAMEGGGVFIYDRLADLMPAAADFEHLAAGVLAIPISRKPRDYVLLFRKEQIQSVTWGGNPHKAVTYGKNGARLTPRASFDAWQEEVRGKCVPFTSQDAYIGETLRSVLIEVVLRLTESAQAEATHMAERQKRLIGELNHRVRNILALIRGIVRQSRDTREDIGGYIQLLEGRIEALARAHDQITRDKWNPAPLDLLISTEAKAYLSDKAGRLHLSGEPVLLEPEAYSTLALVIHELVTNNAKYGALSDSGTVAVNWRLTQDDGITIEWQESGGPPVHPPRRRGFGSTIIENALAHDLGGESHVEFRPAGLRAELLVPAPYIRAAGAGASRSSQGANRPDDGDAPSRTGPASRPDMVLLVEDSLIIAMDVEDMLNELGVAKVRTAANVAQALGLMDEHRFDMAILDLNLGDETSLPIAARLIEQDIPFLFATGYGDQIDLEKPFSSIPMLQKPYNIEDIRPYLHAR